MIEIRHHLYENLLYKARWSENMAVAVRQAVFRGVVLNGAGLDGVNLRSADLRSAALCGASLENADLRNVVFRGADLREANLRGANLKDADLSITDLRGTDLRGANLDGVCLRGANLKGAYLGGATLRNVNFDEYGLVPIVEQLDSKVLEAITTEGGCLYMEDWHGTPPSAPMCGSTHCRAGWALHLAGDAGYALEREVGPGVAGALIYAKSTGRAVPDFFTSNKDALEDIVRCAALEQAPSQL